MNDSFYVVLAIGTAWSLIRSMKMERRMVEMKVAIRKLFKLSTIQYNLSDAFEKTVVELDRRVELLEKEGKNE